MNTYMGLGRCVVGSSEDTQCYASQGCALWCCCRPVCCCDCHPLQLGAAIMLMLISNQLLCLPGTDTTASEAGSTPLLPVSRLSDGHASGAAVTIAMPVSNQLRCSSKLVHRLQPTELSTCIWRYSVAEAAASAQQLYVLLLKGRRLHASMLGVLEQEAPPRASHHLRC